MESQGYESLPMFFLTIKHDLDIKANTSFRLEKAVIKPAFSAGSYQTEAFESRMQIHW
jgi:hypothetical protein